MDVQVKSEETTSPHEPSLKGRSSWGWARKVYLLLWILVALAVVIAYAGTLVFHSRSALVVHAARVVPVPYGFVGRHPLWVGTFYEDVEALNHFYEQQGEQEVVKPSQEAIRQSVRTNMARRAMVNQLAAQNRVWVSSNELDEQFASLVQQASSPERVESAVLSLWGWSVHQYRWKVLRPYVVMTHLADSLKQDPVIGRELSGDTNSQALEQYVDRLAESKTHLWYDIGK